MAAPHVVIDTNVWVVAFRARSGASWELTRLLGADSFEAHVLELAVAASAPRRCFPWGKLSHSD